MENDLNEKGYSSWELVGSTSFATVFIVFYSYAIIFRSRVHYFLEFKNSPNEYIKTKRLIKIILNLK